MKVFFCFLAVFWCSLLFATPFFQDGETQWNIRQNSSEPAVNYAVKEFARAMKLISGADFLPATGEGDSNTVVFSVDPKLHEDEMKVETRNGGLFLTGGSPRSVLYATYSFLQDELGVRWLWPGDDGEFMPKKSTWNLPKLSRSYKPQFKYRGYHTAGDFDPKRSLAIFYPWMARNFANIHRHGRANNPQDHLGIYMMFSSHDAYIPNSYFNDHPEYFAEIKGTSRANNNPCYSQSAVVDIIAGQIGKWLKSDIDRYGRTRDIFSIFPMDTPEYCQCKLCYGQKPSDLWFDFYNKLTDKLVKEFPQVKFSTIAYQWYMPLPTHTVRNSEFVEIATHPRCNIHRYGHPDCKRNSDMLKIMDDWDASGIPLGNYGYEFDIFSDFWGGKAVAPYFYSMIVDAIQNEAKRGHIEMITEIGMGPRKAPVQDFFFMRNRLGSYIYAQMMWNPNRKVEDIIRDYCSVAFGKAADPMTRYFLLMNNTWDSMKLHYGILGSAAHIAPEFLTDSILEQSRALFAEAAEKLGNEKNAAFENEKILFSDWERIRNPAQTLIVPRSTPAEGAKVPKTPLRLAWTPEDFTIAGLAAPFEITMNSGTGGETWTFRGNAKGVLSSLRVSSVGVQDTEWKPAWTFRSGTVSIPFRELLSGRNPTEYIWYIAISSGDKRFPENGFSPMQFLNAAPGKRLLWWSGTKGDDDFVRNTSLLTALREFGWTFETADANTIMTDTPDVYYFRNPSGQNKVPAEAWPVIRKNIQNGAVAFFCSYWNYPLATYMDDPTWATKMLRVELTFGDRKATHIEPGKWLTNPNPLGTSLKNAIMPAYNTSPVHPEYWKGLGYMPQTSKNLDREIPFLLIRPYGKGAVVVESSYMALIRLPWLLVNICTNVDELREDINIPSSPKNLEGL